MKWIVSKFRKATSKIDISIINELVNLGHNILSFEIDLTSDKLLNNSVKLEKLALSEKPDIIFLLKGNHDQNEIKYIIGLCDYFIGSRMHACIAALSQMIPAVGLAYSKKFLGVFDSIGVDDLVIDLRTKSKDGIIAHLSKAFFEREATAQKLSQTVPKAQEEISEIFSPC